VRVALAAAAGYHRSHEQVRRPGGREGVNPTSTDGTRLANWAGTLVYSADHLYQPESRDELQEIVRRASSLRVIGSRHSFNDIADTTGDLVSVARMPRIFELDAAAAMVRVDGGVRYGELCIALDAAGFALNNLASLPHISIAGACATATHGSGDRIGNLATAVSALEVVTADGEVVRFAREEGGEEFYGAVVSLGGLGVVTSLTLDLQPAFRMRQDIYEDLPLTSAAHHFGEIFAMADSVSLFSEWKGPTLEQVWLRRRVHDGEVFEPPAELFGATRATVTIHPIRRMPADACTPQLGVPGPWHERMTYFRLDFVPSSGAEIQSEYLLPREHAVDALLAIAAIREQFQPALQVAEVRTVAADELWMSTASGRASVAFHFTWIPEWEAVRRVLPIVEGALAPFDPRPHWGKVFAMSPEAVQSSYEKLPAFADLLGRHDTAGKFRNPFLDRYIFAGR
jgi:xylitol oxidase